MNEDVNLLWKNGDFPVCHVSLLEGTLGFSLATWRSQPAEN